MFLLQATSLVIRYRRVQNKLLLHAQALRSSSVFSLSNTGSLERIAIAECFPQLRADSVADGFLAVNETEHIY